MIYFYDIATGKFHNLSIKDDESMMLNEIESLIRIKFSIPSAHHSLVVTNSTRDKFHNIYQLSPFLQVFNLIDKGLTTFFYTDDLPPFFDEYETLMTSDQLDITSLIYYNIESQKQFQNRTWQFVVNFQNLKWTPKLLLTIFKRYCNKFLHLDVSNLEPHLCFSPIHNESHVIEIPSHLFNTPFCLLPVEYRIPIQFANININASQNNPSRLDKTLTESDSKSGSIWKDSEFVTGIKYTVPHGTERLEQKWDFPFPVSDQTDLSFLNQLFIYHCCKKYGKAYLFVDALLNVDEQPMYYRLNNVFPIDNLPDFVSPLVSTLELMNVYRVKIHYGCAGQSWNLLLSPNDIFLIIFIFFQQQTKYMNHVGSVFYLSSDDHQMVHLPLSDLSKPLEKISYISSPNNHGEIIHLFFTHNATTSRWFSNDMNKFHQIDSSSPHFIQFLKTLDQSTMVSQ